MHKYEHLFLYIYPFSFKNLEVFNHIAPDPMGQLNVFWHQCNHLCMYCTDLHLQRG